MSAKCEVRMVCLKIRQISELPKTGNSLTISVAKFWVR